MSTAGAWILTGALTVVSAAIGSYCGQKAYELEQRYLRRRRPVRLIVRSRHTDRDWLAQEICTAEHCDRLGLPGSAERLRLLRDLAK